MRVQITATMKKVISLTSIATKAAVSSGSDDSRSDCYECIAYAQTTETVPKQHGNKNGQQNKQINNQRMKRSQKNLLNYKSPLMCGPSTCVRAEPKVDRHIQF